MLTFSGFLIDVPETAYKIEYKSNRQFMDVRAWFRKDGDELRTKRGIHVLLHSLRRLVNLRPTILGDFDSIEAEINDSLWMNEGPV